MLFDSDRLGHLHVSLPFPPLLYSKIYKPPFQSLWTDLRLRIGEANVQHPSRTDFLLSPLNQWLTPQLSLSLVKLHYLQNHKICTANLTIPKAVLIFILTGWGCSAIQQLKHNQNSLIVYSLKCEHSWEPGLDLYKSIPR